MFRKNINWHIFFLKSEEIYFKIFHFLKYTHWSNLFAFYFKSSSKLSSILKITSFLILYIFTVFLRNVLSFIIELSGPLSGFPYVQFKWHYLQLTNLLSHSRSCLFSLKGNPLGLSLCIMSWLRRRLGKLPEVGSGENSHAAWWGHHTCLGNLEIEIKGHNTCLNLMLISI